jgi:UTP:GlnB (protein PII) uridylyltransferase
MANKTSLTNDDFQLWIFNMDDELDRLKEDLPQELASKLDYSDESLKLVEAWILQRYASVEETKEKGEAQILDRLARYVGETIRKQVGGHWDIDLENEKNAYYALPVITGFEEKPTPVCPLTLVTASTARRTGTFISGVLENVKKKLKK